MAAVLVAITHINRGGFFRTEVIQAINPVLTIKTGHGDLLCRGGHGRLLWRARTFLTEEPQTIEWMDTFNSEDFFWDVGSNVGLYSIYAAKFKRCRVISFEPEAQNFALLVDNIVLNEVGELCTPTNLAVGETTGLGKLSVRYITRGGAYNLFVQDPLQETPPTIEALSSSKVSAHQLNFGASLDDLASGFGLEPPTRLKIDVDGIEPHIIAGAQKLLANPRLREILIELNMSSPQDAEVPDIMKSHGFKVAAQRSNWMSKRDRTREREVPQVNMIFKR